MAIRTQRPRIELGYTETADKAHKVATAMVARYGVPCNASAITNDQGETVYQICAHYYGATTVETLVWQEFVAGALAMLA